MPEQTVDLRSALSGLRRHPGVLIGAAVLGAALGMLSVLQWPPTYSSSSLVLLPPKVADPDQMAEAVKTDLRIAMSDSVLGPAARSLTPSMSVRALARHVEVSALTPLVLEIKGRADEPRRAEEISRAVANSDVTYVTESLSSLSNAKRALISARQKELRETLEKTREQIRATTARQQGEDPQSPQGKADATALAKLTAQQGTLVLQLNELAGQTEVMQPSGGASVIQEPSPAKRAGLVTRYLVSMFVGSFVAALIAAGVITLLTRRDQRLRFRDDIADAVGSPVVASVRSRVTSSVAGWITLLDNYAPGTVDAWAWRQALRQLMIAEAPGSAGQQHRGKGMMDHPSSITVITLSGDPRGLAMGPQLAAYAASAGLRTRLVAAQRHEAATTLWAACSSFEGEQDSRPGLWVDTGPGDGQQVDLTVVLAVADRQHPELLDTPETTVVVLALSAGSATAEELARVAVAVDDAGRRIQGIVVADPDNLDRTTGRLLQHDRAQRVPLPTRLTGTPPPRTRRGDVSTVSRRQG